MNEKDLKKFGTSINNFPQRETDPTWDIDSHIEIEKELQELKKADPFLKT